MSEKQTLCQRNRWTKKSPICMEMCEKYPDDCLLDHIPDVKKKVCQCETFKARVDEIEAGLKCLQTIHRGLIGLFANRGICEPVEGFVKYPQGLRTCIEDSLKRIAELEAENKRFAESQVEWVNEINDMRFAFTKVSKALDAISKYNIDVDLVDKDEAYEALKLALKYEEDLVLRGKLADLEATVSDYAGMANIAIGFVRLKYDHKLYESVRQDLIKSLGDLKGGE